MSLILSASRRTDIPCYYSEWFMNRIKEGYVVTRNPLNHKQLSRIPLSPDIIDCIVFWTKDAYNIMPYLKEIDDMGYRFYFQFTITPYDKNYEKNLRDKSQIEETFIKLSSQIGKGRVLWRYDPIIINDTLTISYHKTEFERLCKKLSPFTESVTISFVDQYAKLKTKQICDIDDCNIAELSSFIGATAEKYGISAMACCEKTDLTPYGIKPSSCIDKKVIEKTCGCGLKLQRDKNQRELCGCMESIDIGIYHSCMNHCIYCYANNSYETAERNYKNHNPQSEILIGLIDDKENVKLRKICSNRINQITFI